MNLIWFNNASDNSDLRTIVAERKIWKQKILMAVFLIGETVLKRRSQNVKVDCYLNHLSASVLSG